MRFYAPLFILESHACLSYLSEIQPTLATTPFGTTSFGGRFRSWLESTCLLTRLPKGKGIEEVDVRRQVIRFQLKTTPEGDM